MKVMIAVALSAPIRGDLARWAVQAGHEVVDSPPLADVLVADATDLEAIRTACAAGSSVFAIDVPPGTEIAGRLIEAGVSDFLATPMRQAEFESRLQLLERRGKASAAERERYLAMSIDLLAVVTGDTSPYVSARLDQSGVDLLAVVRGDGRIEHVNGAWSQALGFGERQTVGRPVGVFIHPDDRASLAAAAGRMSERNGIVGLRLRMRARGGKDRWILWNTSPPASGRRVYCVGRDVTELVRAEQAVEEREARLRAIVETAVDGIVVVDARGQIDTINPAAERLFGWRTEELRGQSMAVLMPESLRERHLDAVRRYDPAARSHMVGVHREIEVQRRDGSTFLGEIVVSPMNVGGRRMFTGIVRDISERKRVEQEREELLAALESNALVLTDQAAEMDALREAAEYQASHDMLTGVMNRRAWVGAARAGRYEALALFDIDRFKRINDTFGHPAGDAVLKEVAGRLQRALGDHSLGRVGGEEFAVVFAAPLAESQWLCEQALAAVAEAPVELPSGQRIDVTISAGIAPWHPVRHSPDDSLSRTYEDADRALYDAKACGRARVSVALARAA